MAVGSVSSSPFLQAIQSGLTPIARVRTPTVTAAQAEGTFSGNLPNGQAVSFAVSDVENGRAQVRYTVNGVTRSTRVNISANVLRVDNVQIAIGAQGQARFAGVFNGRVVQTTLTR